MPSHTHNTNRVVGWPLPTSTSVEWGVVYESNDATFPYTDWRNDTNSTGGSQAHNNMPPYLTVYMWKRVS